MFIEAKDDGDGGDNWTTGAIRSCKAPVKSSPPTNQHPVVTILYLISLQGSVCTHVRKIYDVYRYV